MRSCSSACITIPALFALLEDYGRPYVLTWGVDPMRQHPSIGFDNRAATFEMTRHLIGLGHRRFGLLSAVTDGNDRATERGAGMRAALAQAGLALDERCVQYGPIDLAAAAAHDAAAACRRSCGRPRWSPPTTCSRSAP